MNEWKKIMSISLICALVSYGRLTFSCWISFHFSSILFSLSCVIFFRTSFLIRLWCHFKFTSILPSADNKQKVIFNGKNSIIYLFLSFSFNFERVVTHTNITWTRHGQWFERTVSFFLLHYFNFTEGIQRILQRRERQMVPLLFNSI